MTDKEKIERLEMVVGTLITWLTGSLRPDEQQKLLEMLQAIKLEKR